MAKAVDDSASPKPTMVAAGQSSPASRCASPASSDAGDHDLRQAEPENLAPQAPQPRRLELEADDEQQEDDAELGDVQDFFAAGDQPRCRADGDAGGEVAEDGAETDALEQRRRDHRAAEQQQNFGIDLAGAATAMPSSLC